MNPLAEAAEAVTKELCREPAGKPEGGQFASCDTASAEASGLTPEQTAAMIQRVSGAAGPMPQFGTREADPDAPVHTRAELDAVADKIMGRTPKGEPVMATFHKPVGGLTRKPETNLETPRLYDRERSVPQVGDLATVVTSPAGEHAVVRGSASVYLEPGSGVSRFALDSGGGSEDVFRFAALDGKTDFDITGTQLRKVLGVPEDGQVRIVKPTDGRSGMDIYVSGQFGFEPFKERYHINPVLGTDGETSFALMERETGPGWASSVAITQRDRLQAEDIHDWVSGTPNASFHVRTSPVGEPYSSTTEWSTLRELPAARSNEPPVYRMEHPADNPDTPADEIPGSRFDPFKPWQTFEIEPKSLPITNPALFNSEDTKIIASGRILEREPDWLPYAAAIAGAPPGTEVQVTGSATRASINVIGDHTDGGGNHVLHLYEEDGNLRLKIDYLFLNETGTGLGKQIIGSIMNAARQNGIEVVELYAGGHGPPGSSTMNGYYSWPRMGFNAEIPVHLQAELIQDGIEASDLNELFSTHKGAQWWKENGESADMEFDTTDGSESMRTLGRYLKLMWGQNPFGAVNEVYEEVEGVLVLEPADAVMFEAEQELCREPAGKPEGGQFASCGGSQGSGASGAVQTAPEPPTGSTEPIRGFEAEIPSGPQPLLQDPELPVHLSIDRGIGALVVGSDVQFNIPRANGPNINVAVPHENLRLLTGAPSGSTITISPGAREGEWTVYVAGELAGHEFNERSKLSITPAGAVGLEVTSRINNAALPRAVWDLPEFRDRVDGQAGSAELMGYTYAPLRAPPAPPSEVQLRIGGTGVGPDPTVIADGDNLKFMRPGGPDAIDMTVAKSDIVALLGGGANTILGGSLRLEVEPGRAGAIPGQFKWTATLKDNYNTYGTVQISHLAQNGNWYAEVPNIRFNDVAEIAQTHAIDRWREAGNIVRYLPNPVSPTPVPNEPERSPDDYLPPVVHSKPIDLGDEPMLYTGRDVNVIFAGAEERKPEWLNEAAAMIGAPPGAEVIVKPRYVGDNEYSVRASFPGGSTEITVFNDEKRVYFDGAFLGEKAQKGGLGSRMMASALLAAQSNGFESFDLSAAGQWHGSMNGYYTWPRIGFDGHLDSDVASRARGDLHVGADRIGNKISDIFTVEGGTDWWYRHGHGFHAEFDLNPGSNSWKTLGSYLKHRFGSNPLEGTRMTEWLAEGSREADICRVPAGTPEGGQFAACGIHEGDITGELFKTNISKNEHLLDRYLMRAIRGDPEVRPEEHHEYVAGIREVMKFRLQVLAAVDAMTPEERHALRLYLTGSEFSRPIGNTQQGKVECELGVCAAFESALAKLPNYEGVVHHGRKYDADRAKEFLSGLKVGGTMDFKRSYSSSLSRAKADSYTETVLVKIHSKTGKPVAWLSRHPTQREVLFPKNVKLRITSIERDPHDPKQTIITAEEIVEANESLVEAGEVIAGNLCREPAGTEAGGQFAACDTTATDLVAPITTQVKDLVAQGMTAGDATAKVVASQADAIQAAHAAQGAERIQAAPVAVTTKPSTMIDREGDKITLRPVGNTEHKLEIDEYRLRSLFSSPGATSITIEPPGSGTPTDAFQVVVKGTQARVEGLGGRDFTNRYTIQPVPIGSDDVGWKIESNFDRSSGDTPSYHDADVSLARSHALAAWLDEDPLHHQGSGMLVSEDYYTAGDVRLNVATGPHIIQSDAGTVDLYTEDDAHSISLTKDDLRAMTGMPIDGSIMVTRGASPDSFRISATGESHNGSPMGTDLLLARYEIEGQPVWNLTQTSHYGYDMQADAIQKLGIERVLPILNATSEDPVTTKIADVKGFEPPHDASKDIVVQPKLPFRDMASDTGRGGSYPVSWSRMAPREYDPQMFVPFTSGTVEITAPTPPAETTVAGFAKVAVTADNVRLTGDRFVDLTDAASGITIPRDQFLRMVGAPDGGTVEIKATGTRSFEVNVSGSVGNTPISDRLTMFYRAEYDADLMNANDAQVYNGTKEPYASGWVLASDKYRDEVGLPTPFEADTPEGARELVMRGAWDQWKEQGGAVERYIEPVSTRTREPEPDTDDEDEEDPYDSMETETEKGGPAYAVTDDILGEGTTFDGTGVEVGVNPTDYTDEQIAILAGAPPGSSVRISAGPDVIMLMVSGEHTNDQMVRLYPKEGTMSWSRYFPNEGYQQGSLGSKIFGTIVAGARAAGFKKISIHAIGDYHSANDVDASDRASGYLAWVKLGGNASLTNVDFASERAREEAQRKGWETIGDVVSRPGGMTWWYKNGGEWSGSFDTRDGSYSMKRLGSKLKRKFGKNPFGEKNEFPEGEFFDEAYNDREGAL